MKNKIVILHQSAEECARISDYYDEAGALLLSQNGEQFGEKPCFVTTGEEALDYVRKGNVLVLLVDINIPDMRLRELAERTDRMSKGTKIFVCFDELNPISAVKLSNRYHVAKMYASPIDTKILFDDINSFAAKEAALSAGSRDKDIDPEMAEDIKAMSGALESLMGRLKRQQKSYSKLGSITKCFTDSVSENRFDDACLRGKYIFVEEVFDALLRMQTTGSFDVDAFADGVRSDISTLTKISPDVKVNDIVSCLMEGQSRAYVQNIRFSIFLIARYFAQFYKGFEISVNSHYITTNLAEFIVNIIPDNNSTKLCEDAKDKKCIEEYSEYVRYVITDMSKAFRVTEKDGTVTYYMTFPVTGE